MERDNELILCSCGCGKTRWKYDSRGRSRTQIKGHSLKGKERSEIHRQRLRLVNINKKLSEETCKKISEALKGEKNGMFGKHHTEAVKQFIGRINTKQKVGYKRLHVRIRNKLPKPEYCQMCNKVPPYDVACVTNIYEDDLINWSWYCRSCHKKYDYKLNKKYVLEG